MLTGYHESALYIKMMYFDLGGVEEVSEGNRELTRS